MNGYDQWMIDEAQGDPEYWQVRQAEDDAAELDYWRRYDEAEKAQCAFMESNAGPCPFCRNGLSYNMMTDAMECDNCGAEWGDPEELKKDQANAAALDEWEHRRP